MLTSRSRTGHDTGYSVVSAVCDRIPERDSWLGVKPPRFLPAWAAKLGGSVGETLARSLRISNRKLKEASGWTPAYPGAREGLRASV